MTSVPSDTSDASSEGATSQQATLWVPADFARRHALYPVSVQEGVLRIVSARPLDEEVVDDLRLITGLEIDASTDSAEAVAEGIAERYQVTVERMLGDLGSATAVAEGKNLHDIEVMANEPTVVNLVNVVISTALRERASDIHLIPFESSIQLRYRIDGLLQEKQPPPKQLHPAIVSRIKIMADLNIAERFLPQDGHIQIQHRGARVDIRVGTLPTIHGESVVMRLLEKDNRLQTPEELGLDPQRAALLRHLTQKPHGLFLATGPTGSGKTTTLYAILQQSFTVTKKIITIEDPVEYELPGVAQIPVKPGRGFTFATGLRAILRQDPNVVMVGEIRDAETAEIAIRAALTGHQVLSTLHTNDAAGAVTRLIDMGVEPFLVASSLDGVLAQRLVRRLCPACRRPAPAPAAIREKFTIPDRDYWTGTGCDDCRGTGYRGRIGIFELLEVTQALRELILQRRSSADLKASVRGSMITLFDDGLRKAIDGLTSLEEVVRVCSGDDKE